MRENNWVIGGDYNATLCLEERRGGRSANNLGLVLQYGGSNHWPISLVVSLNHKLVGIPFKTEVFWYEHPKFKKALSEWWRMEEVIGDLFANKSRVEPVLSLIKMEAAKATFIQDLKDKEADKLDEWGFSHEWCNWVLNRIPFASYAILINGVATDFFDVGRGLRQCDTLSPFFIFDYDTLLFGKASAREARAIKTVLRNNELVTGQKINNSKSRIFFLKDFCGESLDLQRIMGFKADLLPSSYLGMPLVDKRTLEVEWRKVVDKVQRKLTSWKGKWLSLAGRITLIKTSIAFVPIYTMSAFQIPSKVAKMMEDTQRIFLWHGSKEVFKYNLVKWGDVCSPKCLGGAGFRNIKNMNRALGAKLAWQIYEEKDPLSIGCCNLSIYKMI
ncbi:hypothetical protein SUGI_1164730 [Cryptomeria japonica]|nr:hypothetical protein SUGI_1164730 [Cryptomeria japonica]